MPKIKCIIVDDEESARDVLSNLLTRFCPQVEILDKCSNILQAVESVKKHQPDVVFLDIEMPNYAGYEIVKFFDKIDFEIIFVTAFDKYALRAFEIAALDYLLKPVDIERLKQTVERLESHIDDKQYSERISVMTDTLKEKELKNIAVIDKGFQKIIAVENIIAIEAQESYCIIHTTERNYIASRNLKHFETTLESVPAFFRVHKSWLINRDHLKHYSKSELSIQLSNGIITKLSKYRKAEFESLITS